MKKIKNIVIGGIQQKLFNLVLIFIVLVMAAYTVVILHQSSSLNALVTETNEQQKQSIVAISQSTMDAVINDMAASVTKSFKDNVFDYEAMIQRLSKVNFKEIIIEGIRSGAKKASISSTTRCTCCFMTSLIRR